MDKKEKYVLIFIIILVISIISVVCTALFINKKNKEPGIKTINQEDNSKNLQAYTTINVTKESEFYRVSALINTYLDKLNRSKYVNRDGSSFADSEDTKKSILYTLSEEYVNKNSITLDNIYDHVQNFNTKMTFIPVEMKVMEGFGVNQYAVYGEMLCTTDTQIQPQKLYMKVNVDYKNETYSIEPIDEQIGNMDDIKLENNIKEININTSNKIYKLYYTNEDIVKQKFSNIIMMNIADSKLMYDRYLDENYKQAKFPKYEDYQKYLEISKERFEQLDVYKYSTTQNGDVTEGRYSDAYDRFLYIYQTNCSDFKVKYDEYTILEGDSLDEYNKSSAHDKVQLNIARWVEMLNNKDYIAAFNVLDENFRNENFGGNVETFKETIESQMGGQIFEFQNDKTVVNSFQKINDTYVQKIVLKQKNTSDLLGGHDVTGSVVMKLIKGAKFTMSYDFDIVSKD